MERTRIKIQFWVEPELAERIGRVAKRGDITRWAVSGLKEGVARREEEIIEAGRRRNLLQAFELSEKAS